METTLHQKLNKDSDSIDLTILLRDLLRGLKKFWWLIGVLSVVCAGFSLVRCQNAYVPLYKSSASLTVLTRNSTNGEFEYSFNYSAATSSQMAAVLPSILQTSLAREMIAEDLGRSSINGSVSISATGNSNLFSITAISTTPEDAAMIVNAAIRILPKAARYIIGDIQLNLMEEPKVPQAAYNAPQYFSALVTGMLLGAVIGFLAVFLYAFTRKTIRKETEVENVLQETFLGALPKIKRKEAQFAADAVTNMAFQESIRSLAFRLELQMRERNEKVLLISSTLKGEGATTVALNLARAYSEIGKRVMLLDMSPSRKSPYRTDIQNMDTVFKALASSDKAAFERLKTADRGFYYFAGCGHFLKSKYSSDPDGFRQFMKAIAAPVDYVIIDTSNCMEQRNGAIAAECADALLYVIQQDRAPALSILECIDDLCGYQLRCAGCVVNRANPNAVMGYGSAGKYHYYKSYYNQSKNGRLFSKDRRRK